jgi:membrane protein
MLRTPWEILKRTVLDFIEDGALSQGAAIAYYTVFAMAPVLIIVIAIAGLAFGEEAARGAIVQQLGGLMGYNSAAALQEMIRGASDPGSGLLATALGIGTLLLTATGVFGQIQTALNQIWKAEPTGTTITGLIRARLASLGLVATLGFLLAVSLVVSAAISAMNTYMHGVLPGWHVLLQVLNFLVSFVLIAVLFAAVYKILPDKSMEWRDVAVGAVVTTLLFDLGKLLIGLYIGSSKIASTYGGAAALVVMLLWVYYSAQIFLLGAEFTKAYAETRGSHARKATSSALPARSSAKPAE